MKRGEVYQARLDPIEGSEQARTRPVVVVSVVIVSRDAINDSSPVLIAVPCAKYVRQRIYPSQIVLQAGEGGLDVDSVAMAEQVRSIDKGRLLQFRGTLPQQAMKRLEQALLIALDLP